MTKLQFIVFILALISSSGGPTFRMRNDIFFRKYYTEFNCLRIPEVRFFDFSTLVRRNLVDLHPDFLLSAEIAF